MYLSCSVCPIGLDMHSIKQSHFCSPENIGVFLLKTDSEKTQNQKPFCIFLSQVYMFLACCNYIWIFREVVFNLSHFHDQFGRAIITYTEQWQIAMSGYGQAAENNHYTT